MLLFTTNRAKIWVVLKQSKVKSPILDTEFELNLKAVQYMDALQISYLQTKFLNSVLFLYLFFLTFMIHVKNW